MESMRTPGLGGRWQRQEPAAKEDGLFAKKGSIDRRSPVARIVEVAESQILHQNQNPGKAPGRRPATRKRNPNHDDVDLGQEIRRAFQDEVLGARTR